MVKIKHNLSKSLKYFSALSFILALSAANSFADKPNPAASNNSWSQFRFDQENTGFNQPFDNPFFKKKWTFSLGNPRVTYSSPAVILDRGSQNGDGDFDNSKNGWKEGKESHENSGMLLIGTTQGKLLALRTFDGTQLWSFQTQGEIYSSPAVLRRGKNSQVFVASSDGILRALDLKGKQKWMFQTGDAILSSPTVGSVHGLGNNGNQQKKDKSDSGETKGPEDKGKDVVVIGSNDGKLYLLPASPDDTTPEPIWTTSLHNPILGKPALDGDNDEIYIGTQNCTLFLVSAKDGKVLDKFKVNGPMRSSPAIKTINGGGNQGSKTLVFFGAGHKFYMLESSQGKLHEKFSKDIGKLVVSSPALAGSWGSDGKQGNNGLGDDQAPGDPDGKDNGNHSTKDTDENGNGGKGDVKESPQNLVLIGSDDGKVYAFQVDTSDESAKLAATFDTSAPIYSSAAGTSDFFAVGSDNHKILTVRLEDLLKSQTPAAAWNFTTGASVESSPALSGGSLYVASDDGNLYAFKRAKPGKADHFDLSAPTQVAAVEEFPLGITARDVNGNLAAGYQGTAQVSGTDPSGQPQDMNSVVFDKNNQGSSTLELSLITVGNWTLTATDENLGISGTAQLAVTTLAGFLSPGNGELVNNIVEITGDQSDTEHIEWAPSGSNQWTALARDISSPHLAAKWDTGTLASGPYDLRLIRTADSVELGRITVAVGVPNFEKTLNLPTPNKLTDVDLGDGRLFAVDQQHNKIDLFNGLDSPSGSFGGYGNRTGELNGPNKAAAAPDGTLYVADTGNSRVEVFPAWSNLLPFDIGQGVLKNPQAVEVRGNVVYVLDGNTIDRFSLGGQLISSNLASNNGPYSDLAVDDQGRLYLANTGAQKIEIYGPDGSFDYAFDGRGKQSPGGVEASWIPSSVAFADDGSLTNTGGRIYITDSANYRVQKFGLDGNHLMTFGGFGAAHGQFDQPAASSANGQGAIYVADAGNQRLEKFSQPILSLVPTPTPGLILTVNLTANPDVFDPAVTGTSLAYTLGQAANVTLTITSGTGNIVFQQSYVGGSFGGMQGMNQVLWNGLSGGKPLPDGSYTVTLTATANGQQATAQVIVTIQTGAVAPAITPTPINTSTPTPVPPTPTPTPVPFSIQGFSLNPNSMERGDSTHVLFTLPVTALMTIQVIDKNGKLVYTTTFTGNAGANNYIYDGSRNVGSGLGGTLPPGTYTFILSGTAPGGSDSKQTILTVTP